MAEIKGETWKLGPFSLHPLCVCQTLQKINNKALVYEISSLRKLNLLAKKRNSIENRRWKVVRDTTDGSPRGWNFNFVILSVSLCLNRNISMCRRSVLEHSVIAIPWTIREQCYIVDESFESFSTENSKKKDCTWQSFDFGKSTYICSRNSYSNPYSISIDRKNRWKNSNLIPRDEVQDLRPYKITSSNLQILLRIN